MTTPISEVAVATIFHECWLDEGRDARSFVRGTATLSEAAVCTLYTTVVVHAA